MEILSMNVVVSAIVDPWVTTLSFVVALAMRIQESKNLIFKMNTPTKRIFYLFGPKIVKNEPQTKVWGSLTCKLRLCSWLRTNFAADYAGCAPTSQPITLVARQLRSRLRWLHDRPARGVHSQPRASAHRPRRPRYLTPAFFLARSIAAICSSESLMEP